MEWALAAAAAAAALALASGAAARPVLHSLPEPADEDAEGKIPYATLPTGRFVGGVCLLSLASGLVAFGVVTPPGWLAWAALAGPGALAIAVDGATTWLPRLLTWAMTLVAALGVGLWAGVTGDPWVAARAAIGAVAVGGFFYLFWLLTKGIGFGDVRLMAAAGGVMAAESVQVAVWGVLLGTFVGAVWGVVRRIRWGPGEFAYGPSLWAGPFLALLVTLPR